MLLNTLMISFVRDVRHTLRLAVRSPGFTVAALLTIALGVGGTAAVFSVVYGVLLRPLPYPEPDRIVSVAEEHPGAATAFGRVLFTNLTYSMWEPGARPAAMAGAPALLLAGEAALAVMLLVSAVLLGRSFATLVQVDAGYDADHVLVGSLHFTGAAGREA